MDIEELLTQLRKHSVSMVEFVNGLSEETYLKKPSENSWSISEVIDHLYILENLINKALVGKTIIEDRNPEEKLKIIKAAFGNTVKRYAAPDFIIPKIENIKTRDEMLMNLAATRSTLEKILRENDLIATCLELSHPYFGTMTRYELANVVLCHSIRHFEQINRITQAV